MKYYGKTNNPWLAEESPSEKLLRERAVDDCFSSQVMSHQYRTGHPHVKTKWVPLTLEAKLWICEQKQQDASLTRNQLCELVTELSRLALADHDMNMTREAKPKHKEFDQLLRQWVKSFEFCLPDDQIRAQGFQLLTELGCADDLRLGGGWMSSFKRRHKIDKCWHLKGGGKRMRPASVRDCPERSHIEGSKR